MDLHLATPGPFTYLVGEHARAVVAIQDLQREVTSLLSFRDHVLDALPHLHHLQAAGGPATPRPRPPPQTPGGKSLSEGPPTAVADSGFSTDKASTSMGKSSSSSSGELSGGRWTLGDTPEGPAPPPPIGSSEDELWALLEVIERKGTRLRRELERSEVRGGERDSGHASDPTTGALLGPHSGGGHGAGDWWPHSLPGAGPRPDFVPGLEAWGEVERLRVDRLYLMGRLQRAEAEGGAAHQRLLDLHTQFVSLASEKRRLEEAFRVLRGGDIPLHQGGGPKGPKGVIVSVGMNGGETPTPTRRSSSTVRIGEDILLPRVLKVPIREKWGSRSPSRIPQGVPNASSVTKSDSPSPSRTIVHCSPKTGVTEPLSPPCPTPMAAGVTSPPSGADRVVIERERSASRVDGGLSMPASLLKGVRVKVRPDKQRISAILKEKDVLALQKQLLTTVMETEVLRRQLELAGEEWESKLGEWENERQKHQDIQSSLKSENATLRKELEHHRGIKKADVGVWMCPPPTHSVGVGTGDEADVPTFSVHQGPNVKYDVVVYEDTPTPIRLPSTKTPPSVAPRKPPPSVEKPPRRTRPLSVGPGGDAASFGRDSLGRMAKVPLKPSTRTPPATPRSSPAPSMSVPRSSGGRTPTHEAPQGGHRGSSSSGNGGRSGVGRRDSLKVAMGAGGTGALSPVAKGPPSSGGTHKNTPWLPRNASGSIRRHSQEKSDRLHDNEERHHGDGEKTLPPRNDVMGGSPSPRGNDVGFGSSDFFDSISDSSSSSQCLRLPRGMYSPHTHPEPYLSSPPTRLWAPFYAHTLPLPPKGAPTVESVYYEKPWGETDSEEHSPLPSDSLEFEFPPSYGALLTCPSFRKERRDLEVPFCKGSRRKLPFGVLRIKKTPERPSILSMGSLTRATHN